MGYLVATDGSTVSDSAVIHAAHEAAVWGRSLTIVHVLTPEPKLVDGELVLPASETAIETGQTLLAEAESLAFDTAAEHNVDIDISTELLAGWPADTITDYARTHPFDGIFVGHRGLSDASSSVLGSVAKSVLDKATVPVTIIKK